MSMYSCRVLILLVFLKRVAIEQIKMYVHIFYREMHGGKDTNKKPNRQAIRRLFF